jgi:hypothetical protein
VTPRLVDGKVMIPMRAEGPHGLIGDGLVQMLPSEPEYDRLKAWLESEERPLANEPFSHMSG